MNGLAMLAPTDFEEFKQCIDNDCGIVSPNERGSLSEDYPESELMGASIIIGVIWVALTYVPIMTWYLWRRPGIREMMLQDINKDYYNAFNFMWKSHYFVFQLPAIVFPLTFLGSQTVNHFYMLLNYWVGTVLGGIIALISTLLWIVALIRYTPYGDLQKQHIVAEIFAYIFLTFGLWLIAFNEWVPKAYEYLQLSLPANERRYDGTDLNPEGSEQ